MKCIHKYIRLIQTLTTSYLTNTSHGRTLILIYINVAFHIILDWLS